MYLLKISYRKCRRWHFQDPKFKKFLLWSTPPGSPRFGALLAQLTFLPQHAPSKSHAMLLTTGMKSMPKDKIISNVEEQTWSRRGWGGGEGYIFNIVIAKGWGSTIFIRNYLGGGGKVLIHHIFLNSPSPHA